MTDGASGPEGGWPSPIAGPDARSRRWGDLRLRLLSALVLVVLAIVTVLAGGPAFVLFWLTAALAMLWEWQRLIGQAGAARRVVAGALGLVPAAVFAATGLWPAAAAALIGGALAAGLAAGPALRGMAVAGVVYAGALLLAVTVLRASSPGGVAAIVWLFAVVWGTDVLAYFAGRLVGGPKLWPRLSPSKTWSGFLVGVVSGATAGLLAAPEGSSQGAVFAIGLVTAVLAQGGDLFESSLKRRHGVKDASQLIPGHGGVMDRLDGFVVAAVFAACVGTLHAGLDAPGAGLFNWP